MAKKQFSNADDQRTKQVANARIHVERVIGRMKDFDMPLEMIDIFYHIVTVTAALVNPQPPMVPLKCRSVNDLTFILCIIPHPR